MSKVQRSTRQALTAAGGINGVFPVTDVWTGKKFYLRGALSSYWHIDTQPETKKDWDIICEITNNKPRDAGWPARPVTAPTRNGTEFGFGLFTYTHEPIVYSAAYNPKLIGPKDAHHCLHPYFALTERPGGANNQYRRGNDACIIAEGASAPVYPGPTTVSYQVEIIKGPTNIRSEASTARGSTTIVGAVSSPRRFTIDRETRGTDAGALGGVSLWGRIANDKVYTGMWVALRLVQTVAAPPVVTLPPVITPSSEKTYIVVEGDTLYRIATKTGRSWQSIADINGIRDPYTIVIGQQLLTS